MGDYREQRVRAGPKVVENRAAAVSGGHGQDFIARAEVDRR
jgi:hypothetical protein